MDNQVRRKIEEFFENYPVRSLAAKEILIFANEDPSHVFHLVEGKIGQYDVTRKGQQVMVNVFKPPAFFPMSWAINKTPNEYLFEAMEPTVMRLAPPDAVVTFLKSEPDVLFDLLSRVYKGTDGLLRQNALLMEGSAVSLLVFELLVSCMRFGKPDGKGGYKLAVKENELAARTGLARETVSRNLQALKAKRLLLSGSGVLHIPDVAKLQDILSQDEE
jgi:CRP-like cAMP-binding protein